MKHPLPGLDSLKVFEAAARHLSFSRAAEELCITRGAVSYQIQKLESELSTALFKRSVRQVLLTDAGQKMLQTTQRVFADLKQGIERIEPGRQQTVLVAVTTYVASRWLSPLVTEFCNAHPEIALQFVHDVNTDQFRIGDVDIAVRWGNCTGDTDTTRLREIPMALFPACSPHLITMIGEETTPNRFDNITLLCENRHQDLWLEWAAEKYDLSDNPRRIIDDANVRVQAAIDGQGMVLADDMMQAEIRNRTLEVPTPDELSGYGYTIMRNPHSGKPAARNLVNWLIQP